METKVCRDCGAEKSVYDFFRNRWGFTSLCNECAARHRSDGHKRKKEERAKNDALVDRIEELYNQLEEEKAKAEEQKVLQLDDFTPRQIFAHLKSLGFKWEKITYTKVEEVDWNKI